MVVVASTLPNVFASALDTIEWPLGPTSSPPLHLASLEELKGLRKANPRTGRSPLDELVANVPESVESWFPLALDDGDSERRHFGLISTALLLIGHGYTDECHNLVTPLSWPDDIYFAYGPSQYSKVSPAARAYATYTHCLVHRREAFNVGEFGMMGFANGNFWSNAVKTSPGVDLLPHQELHASVQELSTHEFGGDTQVQEWCQDHEFVSGNDDSFFESRAVHQLCATVLRDPSNTEFKAFAEKVAASEVRILLLHALRRAGYSMDSMTKAQEEAKRPSHSEVEGTNNSKIDEDIALSAARKVSSAHLSNFVTGGSIILRRVVGDLDADATVLSAAAGLACELLQSPACKRSSTPLSTTGDTVKIIILRVDVGDLGPGDCLAAMIVSNSDDGSPDANNSFLYILEACAADDPNVLFVNRLHGTRGETPTSVVQWSKGTVF
jgi:hypothetical protein